MFTYRQPTPVALFNKKSTKELIESLKEKRTPGKREVIANHFERDAVVTILAKRRANGYCQLCEKKAPFNTIDGFPYLETHHVTWLSRGGSDTLDNTVALCPNCHRKMHILDEEKDIKILKNKAKKKDKHE